MPSSMAIKTHGRAQSRSQLRECNIKMPDGCVISALHGRPKTQTTNSLRAAILVHGFAAERTENGLFVEAATHLLSQGYLVLAYDWRGLGKSAGDFSNSVLDTHVEDFRSIVQWLAWHSKIPTQQFCAIGFSLGAALIAKAIGEGQELGSAVFWSPATRPSLFMWPRYNTKENIRSLSSSGFIIKPGSKVKLGRRLLQSLRETDLGERSFDLGLPLLVCHGSKDLRIPVHASRQSFDCITDKDIARVCYAEFVGASHSFRPKRFRRELIELLLQWLGDSSLRETHSQKRVFPQESPVLPLLASCEHSGSLESEPPAPAVM